MVPDFLKKCNFQMKTELIEIAQTSVRFHFFFPPTRAIYFRNKRGDAINNLVLAYNLG